MPLVGRLKGAIKCLIYGWEEIIAPADTSQALVMCSAMVGEDTVIAWWRAVLSPHPISHTDNMQCEIDLLGEHQIIKMCNACDFPPSPKENIGMSQEPCLCVISHCRLSGCHRTHATPPLGTVAIWTGHRGHCCCKIVNITKNSFFLVTKLKVAVQNLVWHIECESLIDGAPFSL